jgi:hypothetical protein
MGPAEFSRRAARVAATRAPGSPGGRDAATQLLADCLMTLGYVDGLTILKPYLTSLDGGYDQAVAAAAQAAEGG